MVCADYNRSLKWDKLCKHWNWTQKQGLKRIITYISSVLTTDAGFAEVEKGQLWIMIAITNISSDQLHQGDNWSV